MSKNIRTISFVIAIAGGCAGEAAFWLLPENIGLRALFKAITGACIIIFALCCRDRHERDFRWIITALVLASIADVVIGFLFPVGVALFALAHICLIILFWKKTPPGRTKLIIWGIVSAVIIVLILILGSGQGLFVYCVAIYAPILLLMVFTAIGQTGLIRIAAFMFFTSDLLLTIYQWKQIHPLLHVVYMGLFYASLLMLAYKSGKS